MLRSEVMFTEVIVFVIELCRWGMVRNALRSSVSGSSLVGSFYREGISRNLSPMGRLLSTGSR